MWIGGRIEWVIHRDGSGADAENRYSRSFGSFTAVGEVEENGERGRRECERGGLVFGSDI